MARSKNSAPSLPASLNDRERFVLEVEAIRFRRAKWAAAIGAALLAVALCVLYVDDPDQSCSTDVVTKTTADPTSSISKPTLPRTASEVTTTRDCAVPGWAVGPFAIGALGLLLAAPYVLRMLPPGSKFAIGSILSLESGTDGVLADQVKQTSEVNATALLGAAERRLALNISIADAPTEQPARDGNHDAGQ